MGMGEDKGEISKGDLAICCLYAVRSSLLTMAIQIESFSCSASHELEQYAKPDPQTYGKDGYVSPLYYSMVYII
jgi:hypothetical protein